MQGWYLVSCCPNLKCYKKKFAKHSTKTSPDLANILPFKILHRFYFLLNHKLTLPWYFCKTSLTLFMKPSQLHKRKSNVLRLVEVLVSAEVSAHLFQLRQSDLGYKIQIDTTSILNIGSSNKTNIFFD